MGGDTDHDNHGMPGGHAYGVIGHAELTDSAGKVVHKLIKMRNPWGSERYNGDWSDDSKLWTPEWRK